MSIQYKMENTTKKLPPTTQLEIVKFKDWLVFHQHLGEKNLKEGVFTMVCKT